MTKQDNKPEETIWQPLKGLPLEAKNWGFPYYDELVEEWHQLHKELTDKKINKTVLNTWLTERRRLFAIETGQIEGLYTLKRGVTEQLITEGLEGVTSSHTIENINDNTIKGLLHDQETALEMVFADIKDNKPLNDFVIKSWHQLITQHQETVTGITFAGGQTQRVQVPFKRKGQYKLSDNNPGRHDGVVFEYCPPVHVQSEMNKLFSLYTDMQKQHLPMHIEAAWLHHRFVRTHPFQDGNGRVSRLLMAYSYIRRGEIPPVIKANEKEVYIDQLEEADRGNLKAFANYLGTLATEQVIGVIGLTRKALSGRQDMYHPNGGHTDKSGYHPPHKNDDIFP